MNLSNLQFLQQRQCWSVRHRTHQPDVGGGKRQGVQLQHSEGWGSSSPDLTNSHFIGVFLFCFIFFYEKHTLHFSVTATICHHAACFSCTGTLSPIHRLPGAPGIIFVPLQTTHCHSMHPGGMQSPPQLTTGLIFSLPAFMCQSQALCAHRSLQSP